MGTSTTPDLGPALTSAFSSVSVQLVNVLGDVAAPAGLILGMTSAVAYAIKLFKRISGVKQG